MCCVAFNTTTSQLERKLFWQVSYADIKNKIRLYIGEKQALIVQDFQSMSKIMGMMSEPEEEKPPVPQSSAEAMAMFSQLKL